jgi:hypothetical protein
MLPFFLARHASLHPTALGRCCITHLLVRVLIPISGLSHPNTRPSTLRAGPAQLWRAAAGVRGISCAPQHARRAQ